MELLYSQFGIQVLCEAAGIPKEGFYSYIKWNKWDNSAYAKHREELRETIQEIFDGSHQRMASMLYFNGVDSVSISKRLGHAQVSTTANIYAHVLEGAVADLRQADLLIIGAGGVMTPADAERMIRMGADFVQIYSAFIYEGPGIVPQMVVRVGEME